MGRAALRAAQVEPAQAATISTLLSRDIEMDSLPFALTSAGLAVLIIVYGFMLAA